MQLSLPWILAALYGAASAVCFVLYAVDKAAARAGRRRVAEATLLLWGIVGGWPGGLLAQRWLRHKTAKRSFQWRYWCTVLLNGGTVAWLACAWWPEQ